MKRSVIGLGLVLFFMVGVAHAQQATSSDIRNMLSELPGKIARHRISIKRCDMPPIIDGKLDDPAWDHAALLTNFIRSNDNLDDKVPGITPAEAESLIYVTYDDTHFYVGARMMEPYMRYLVSASENRDDSVWTDDALEWFLDTDQTGQEVIQLITNNAGIIWDGHDYERKTNVSWTCEGFRVATYHDQDCWYVEWAVPYEGLGMPVPQKGDIWRVQFARQRYTTPTGKRRENTTWVGSIEASFKTPDWFGELLFNENVSTVAAVVPEATFGKQMASISIHNGKATDLPLTFYTSSTGQSHQSYTTTGSVPAGQTKSFDIPMITEDEGANINALQVYSGTELLSVVRRSYFIEPITVPMREKLKYALMLSKAQSQSQAFRDNMVKRALQMQEQLNKLDQIKSELINGNFSELDKMQKWEEVVQAFNAIDIPTPPEKPKLSIWR
ncbi:MAG TPA: hypothetical protein DCM28_23215 [Phycisphaerales bacterium]|nr:hypothetical protein [Phycisphaerales bacterium]